MIPEPGHHIEFESDYLTDKGPATGEVVKVDGSSGSAQITVRFGDEEQTFSWKALDEAGADVRGGLWLVKSHVKGYSKKDGTYVKPHTRAGDEHHPDAVHHPKIGENGKPVVIKRPHHPSSHSTWHNPDAVATFVPGGDIPMSLNGVRISPWRDHPRTVEGWDYLEDLLDEDMYEPPLHVPPGKNVSSGVIIEEPDGRVWVIHPTNRFGGYETTFPKGTEEPELSLQAGALKEAWEESGLKVKITGFVGDYIRTTSVCRMYRAKRVGGDPTDQSWETQGVSLIPKGLLYEHLNMTTDHPIAEDIGAGPKPEPKKSSKVTQDNQKSMFL